MAVEGRRLIWNASSCVKSRLPAVAYQRLGPFDIRGSRIVAHDCRRHYQRHLLKGNNFKLIFVVRT